MYNEKYLSEGEGSTPFNIGIIHTALYFILILTFEILYRIYNRRLPKPF